MGNIAINASIKATSGDLSNVRAYAFKGTSSSKYRVDNASSTDPTSLVVINLSNETSADVTVEGATSILSWTLSPRDGPFGMHANLNLLYLMVKR